MEADPSAARTDHARRANEPDKPACRVTVTGQMNQAREPFSPMGQAYSHVARREGACPWAA
jgi:hypothetical protein